jgi:photosystem II stability/assembly factor-like uncharacterized protein
MLVVVLAGTSGVIRAGDNVWTSHGPYGGEIRTLAVSPKNAGTVYAGTQGGVFRSTDGGANWNLVRPGLTSLLAVDPQDPGTVYAVDYYSGGLFKSTDSGQSWNALSSAPPIGTLAIDPNNPSTLYAGSGIELGSESYFYYGWSGVSMSTDGGSSWNAVNSGLPTNLPVHLLALDPQSAKTLYTIGATLFKTTDGGGRWSAPLRQKLIELNSSESATCDVWGYYLALVTGRPAPQPDQISCFSDGNRDAVITADQYLADVQRYTFAPNFGIVAGLSALVVDPRNSSTLYGGTSRGIFISTDGGLSWNASNSGLPNRTELWVSTLVMDPGNPGTLYAGIIDNTPSGGSQTELYKSTDSGATWIAAGAGLTNYGALSVAIDSKNSSVLYAGTTSGVFKSTDGAASWSPSNSGLSVTSVSALAVDPQNRGTLFAATQTGGHPGGLFKSTDAGTSWVDTGLQYTVDALAVAPQTPALVYAATSAGFVFKSTNGGASWVSTGSFRSAISRLIVDPQNAATLYAATNIGVYKSTDAAANWSAVNSGMPSTPEINTLVLDPQNSNALYATTYDWMPANGGIFRTTDGGRSWSMMNTGWQAALFDVGLVSIDPQNAGTLFVAVSLLDCSWDFCPPDYWEKVKAEPGPGIFKSADGGQSWVKVGWPSGLVTFDPKNPNKLYAAAGTNVFNSSDGGASWNVVGSGLTANVSAVVVDAQDSNTIYAATQGGGVFAITIGAQ